ncbi:MAG: DUF624 domain-containing protein [Clostridia bacterium]|nr:DUF624 domain-containing protein [Clostridia bacterium]
MADINKKHKFNLYDVFFNPNRDVEDAKGEGPVKKYGIAYFFKLFGRNIGRLFSVNLFYIFGNFPILFLLLAISGIVSAESTSPLSSVFPLISGAMRSTPNPVTGVLSSVFALQRTVSVPTVWTYVCYILGALVLVTYGPVCSGCAYILRETVKREPVFMWSDFWDTVKKNFLQSVLVGAVDLIVGILAIYDLFFFYYNLDGTFINSVLFFVCLVVLVIYVMAQNYIFPLLITFKLSFAKLIKNAVLFSLIGLGRNIMALLGSTLLILAVFELLYLYVPIGVAVTLIIGFSGIAFIGVYAAWPKIKEIMIDPYYPDKTKPKSYIDNEEI